MKKKITHNLGLKLASLVLAFILWFLVVQIDDPEERGRFNNVQVKLVNTELLDQQSKVYEVLDDTDQVSVTVFAPRSIISQIRATDIVAEADVSKLTDINTIAIKYYVENAEVTSIEGDHDAVRLSVEDRKSKWIKLTGNTVGEVADGYIVSNVSIDQTNIEITGPESVVTMVDHACVDISVTGATTSLSANIDIQLYDAEGNPINNKAVKKNVDSAHMTVEVLATKDVPVTLAYTGIPANGYQDTGVVEGSMTTVKIAGTSSALANISAITVPEERLDITGKNANLVEIVNLKEYLPDNIRFADKKFDGKITATVYIEPIVEKALKIPASNVTVTNVPDGLVVEFPADVETYDITVSGLGDYIEPLQQHLVSGFIDVNAWMQASGIEELTVGNHTMTIVFNLSDKIAIDEPETVRMKVSRQDDE